MHTACPHVGAGYFVLLAEELAEEPPPPEELAEEPPPLEELAEEKKEKKLILLFDASVKNRIENGSIF